MLATATLFCRVFVPTLRSGVAVAANTVRDGSTPFAGFLQATHFHLAPRSTAAQPIADAEMLDMLEGLCRFTVPWQNTDGAVIDPYLHREFQYATPYFAFAVGTLVRAGHARNLLPHGVAAMERATRQLAGGRSAVPDQHGEFFLASLTEALPVYKGLVPTAQWNRWRDRLRLPIAQIIGSQASNNWRTYAMKGEWQRATLGMVPHAEAVAFIEKYWRNEQRDRFAPAPTSLCHDRTGDPDTLSVALVGEGNLLSLTSEGYDGPSAAEIRQKVLAALQATLLMVDPTGQMPANGRTDDHVWTEVGLQLAFSAASPILRAEGDVRTADAMENSAELSFHGMQRWRRRDGKWSGSFYITKNHFDPRLRVGYQNASQYSNYTGSLMFHLAEMYRLRQHRHPMSMSVGSPAEIGGYATQLDPQFATAFANAGGLQLQFNLRGETEERNDNWWTPLGVVRIARAAWDTRLGPSDGAQTASAAVSFEPEILQDGHWIGLAEMPKNYAAQWSVEMVNPAIVRCALEYHPIAGHQGPSFRNRFILTPDGVLSSVDRIFPDTTPWGVTWPLLTDDGQPLHVHISANLAETSYPGRSDTESFLAVDRESTLDAKKAAIRSTYGDLLPVRMQSASATSHTFVYPHDSSQPGAERVLHSFRVTSNGFQSTIGRVEGNVYVGRTFAGGQSSSVDIDGDGRPDLQFDHECGFVLQLHNGNVTAMETDRPVLARLHGHTYSLGTYLPQVIGR